MTAPPRNRLQRAGWILFVLLSMVACHPDSGLSSERFRALSTSVAVAECTELDKKANASDPHFRLGVAVFRCSGPEPYSIFLVDDGTRSWYVLDRSGNRQSLQDDIVYRDAAGDFPNVGAGGKIEWLLDARKNPVGLLFAVSYQAAQPSGKGFRGIQRHMAYALSGGPAVLVSRAQTPAHAKRALSGYLAVQ